MSTHAFYPAKGAVLGVIGAGTMGAGIAQIAAAAGYRIKLCDAREGAARQAVDTLGSALKKRVDTGKLAANDAQALLARIEPVESVAAMSDAAVVIEAIVERIDAKRALLAQLESIVADTCILASNTSSISITALGRDMRLPGRLAGMHFFNPVPVMKLVEIISGMATDAQVAAALAQLAQEWGKVAIHARSTPGFVVNRIARPFYAEALQLVQECRATPAVVDAALRAAGFRMGPCELMDLIGHDVNFSVTESTYAAYYYDKRFVPSIVQQELVDGGRLGRKSGQGFYDYAMANEQAGRAPVVPVAQGSVQIVRNSGLSHLIEPLTKAGWRIDAADAQTLPQALKTSRQGVLKLGDTLVAVTDGRPAAQLSALTGCRSLAVIDIAVGPQGGPLCLAFSPGCSDTQREEVCNLLRAAGREPSVIDDAPGLVVARTLVMLINEAADAVRQGVCGESDADTAMKLGTNYPAGPFEWLAQLGARYVCDTLDHLDDLYRGERYRTSLLLRDRAWREMAASAA
ncbi:MAG: 3-hydroxyacyl-CoA dehydrogenase [Rhodanobacter sp.]|nr:3-hydroxyacyl-CoA dehydrogenase [Rhodanobacter sp.]